MPCLLRDSENGEFNLTQILEWAMIVWKLWSKCWEWECSRRGEFKENWQFLKYGYRIILNANLVNTEDQIWRPRQHIYPFKTHPSTLLGSPCLWEEDPWMSKGWISVVSTWGLHPGCSLQICTWVPCSFSDFVTNSIWWVLGLI